VFSYSRSVFFHRLITFYLTWDRAGVKTPLANWCSTWVPNPHWLLCCRSQTLLYGSNSKGLHRLPALPDIIRELSRKFRTKNAENVNLGIECECVNWRDLCEVILFWSGYKWIEVSYGEVLGDNSAMYIRVTLYWGYLIVLWLFHLVCILYCGCFNLFFSVWMCVCVGVLIICVLVLTVFCIVCTMFLYCFIYVYLFLFVLSGLL
jgi:hypothetical protein